VNSEVGLTLDEAVAEVIGRLTGLDLQLVPEQDRYQAITRCINQALRSCALEQEWSYYSSIQHVATAHQGVKEVAMPRSVRPRIINDDACRLVDPNTGEVVKWAYFLPRDALHKNGHRTGLWVSHVQHDLFFSRRFWPSEEGLQIHIPVMREPKMFRLPLQPTDPNQPLVTVPDEVRQQQVDFDYPDLIVAWACYYYAQTDPVMQPRVQTLEANYNKMMYALVERDTRNTDAPDQNDWNLGIESSVSGRSSSGMGRPLADERGFFGG